MLVHTLIHTCIHNVPGVIHESLN